METNQKFDSSNLTWTITKPHDSEGYLTAVLGCDGKEQRINIPSAEESQVIQYMDQYVLAYVGGHTENETVEYPENDIRSEANNLVGKKMTVDLGQSENLNG